MRPATAIAIYAVGVVVLSALVAPWAFILVHPHLPKVPFHRVFDRVLLVVALTGLWPLLRSLGLQSWRELGFPRTGTWWRHAAIGYAVGVASFVVAGALLVALGERSFDANLSADALVMQVLKFAATGIVVAIVEETFFRGGVQSALQRGFGTITALIVTSAIYSAVHFLKPKGGASDLAIWSSGFEHLWRVISLSARSPGTAVGFVTLFIAGLILGWAFTKTRALYFPVGVHAGWVVTLKTFALLTGGRPLIENAAMWPVLVAVLAFVAWWCGGNECNPSLAQARR